MTKDTEMETAVRSSANRLAGAIDAALPDGYLFALIISLPSADGSGRANYISNIDRADMVCLLREMVARLEGQPEIEGRA